MATQNRITISSEDNQYYDSWKEERDIILEYNQVNFDDVFVSNILGMGIDSFGRDQAVVKLVKMVEEGGVHHIIPVNPYKLHRYKTNKELNLIYTKADMHLASGSGLLRASRMLRMPIKERVPLLSFLMDVVRIAEKKEYTIFLVGAQPEVVEQAFFNVKKSFSKIRIVGRHGGYFSPERERSVIEAMRKSEAQIIFVGLGFPREDKWIDRVRGEFKNAVFISVGGSIDIISGQVRKAPASFMENGSDWFYRIITRPWRIGRIFRLILLYISVFVKWLLLKKRR